MKLVCAHSISLHDYSNLNQRIENATIATIDHIYFENNTLLFEFAKSKGNKERDNKGL